MLEKIIQKFREQRLEPREEIKLSLVLDTIRNGITVNAQMLSQYYAAENKGTALNITELTNIFSSLENNPYGNANMPFINEFGRVSENFVPYGIAGISVDKKLPLVTLAQVLNIFIQTRNSVILQTTFNSKTLMLLISIINDVLSQTQDFTKIKWDNTEPLAGCNDFDLLVYIGDKKRFEEAITSVPKKYFGIGNYELYVHEEMDAKLVNEAKKHGVIIYPADTQNIYRTLNQNGHHYATAIFTSSKEKAREFISQVQSSFLFINALPTLETRINIYPEDLLKRKSTLFYDKK